MRTPLFVAAMVFALGIACAGPAPVAADLSDLQTVTGRTLQFEHPGNWTAREEPADPPVVEAWVVEPSLGRLRITRSPSPRLDEEVAAVVETQQHAVGRVAGPRLEEATRTIGDRALDGQAVVVTLSTLGLEVDWRTEVFVDGGLTYLLNGPVEEWDALQPGFDHVLSSLH